MRRWELWHNEKENSYSFFSASSEKNRVMARVEGAVKVWETVLSSWNEAMQAQYDYLGYGTYTPMLQDDGTPYPEDEDDEIRRAVVGDDDTLDAPWPGWCPVERTIINVPGDPDPDEVVRTGRLEFVCPACTKRHVWRFGA